MKWYTPEQIANDPRLPYGNADWVRAQLRRGRLEGSLVGNRWLIPEGALDAMLDAGKNQPRRKRRRSA